MQYLETPHKWNNAIMVKVWFPYMVYNVSTSQNKKKRKNNDI